MGSVGLKRYLVSIIVTHCGISRCTSQPSLVEDLLLFQLPNRQLNCYRAFFWKCYRAIAELLQSISGTAMRGSLSMSDGKLLNGGVMMESINRLQAAEDEDEEADEDSVASLREEVRAVQVKVTELESIVKLQAKKLEKLEELDARTTSSSSSRVSDGRVTIGDRIRATMPRHEVQDTEEEREAEWQAMKLKYPKNVVTSMTFEEMEKKEAEEMENLRLEAAI